MQRINCPVCGKEAFPYRPKTKNKKSNFDRVLCDTCGAFAHGIQNFKDGFISHFIQNDCENCSLQCWEEECLVNYCPYARQSFAACLKENCCHYPCSCDIDGGEEYDICKKKNMPFRKTLEHILLGILRELRIQNGYD